MEQVKRTPPRGMTLVEVTLVILILMGMANVLFWGSVAFKHASNRQACVMNLASFQKAVRSLQNLNELRAGDEVLGSQIIGPGQFFETAPQCPDISGVYQWMATVPETGEAFVKCSLALAKDHAPATTSGW